GFLTDGYGLRAAGRVKRLGATSLYAEVAAGPASVAVNTSLYA
ncbi:MAG: hypothetical protein ACI91K_001967, partial [Flavobacteriales bacterium]